MEISLELRSMLGIPHAFFTLTRFCTYQANESSSFCIPPILSWIIFAALARCRAHIQYRKTTLLHDVPKLRNMSRPLPNDWPQRRREVLRRDDYMCRNCERHEDMRGVSLEVHHIVPRSRGGSHEKYNLITLCRHCHNRTHNGNVKAPDDPLGYVGRLREEVKSFQWRQANITNALA